MKYRELIKRVQEIGKFSDEESKDALDVTVEVLAVHLDEPQREEFANELPDELQAIALTVLPTASTVSQDIIEQVMDLQEVDEEEAVSQLRAAWRALREIMSSGSIEDLRLNLPKNARAIFA